MIVRRLLQAPADVGVELAHEVGRGRARLVLGLAHDDVSPQSEPEVSTVSGRSLSKIFDERRGRRDRFDPHQVTVGVGGRGLTGGLRSAPEVHRRWGASAGGVGGQVVVPPLAGVIDVIARPEGTQQCHGLARAAVTLVRRERLPGELTGDDVDREAASHDLLQRLGGPGEHGWVELTDSHCWEKSRGARCRTEGGRQRPRVHPRYETGRDQHVLEPELVGEMDDTRVVVERGAPSRIRDPQAGRVAPTRRREPGNLQSHRRSITRRRRRTWIV